MSSRGRRSESYSIAKPAKFRGDDRIFMMLALLFQFHPEIHPVCGLSVGSSKYSTASLSAACDGSLRQGVFQGMLSEAFAVEHVSMVNDTANFRSISDEVLI